MVEMRIGIKDGQAVAYDPSDPLSSYGVQPATVTPSGQIVPTGEPAKYEEVPYPSGGVVTLYSPETKEAVALTGGAPTYGEIELPPEKAEPEPQTFKTAEGKEFTATPIGTHVKGGYIWQTPYGEVRAEPQQLKKEIERKMMVQAYGQQLEQIRRKEAIVIERASRLETGLAKGLYGTLWETPRDILAYATAPLFGISREQMQLQLWEERKAWTKGMLELGVPLGIGLETVKLGGSLVLMTGAPAIAKALAPAVPSILKSVLTGAGLGLTGGLATIGTIEAGKGFEEATIFKEPSGVQRFWSGAMLIGVSTVGMKYVWEAGVKPELYKAFPSLIKLKGEPILKMGRYGKVDVIEFEGGETVGTGKGKAVIEYKGKKYPLEYFYEYETTVGKTGKIKSDIWSIWYGKPTGQEKYWISPKDISITYPKQELTLTIGGKTIKGIYDVSFTIGKMYPAKYQIFGIGKSKYITFRNIDLGEFGLWGEASIGRPIPSIKISKVSKLDWLKGKIFGKPISETTIWRHEYLHQVHPSWTEKQVIKMETAPIDIFKEATFPTLTAKGEGITQVGVSIGKEFQPYKYADIGITFTKKGISWTAGITEIERLTKVGIKLPDIARFHITSPQPIIKTIQTTFIPSTGSAVALEMAKQIELASLKSISISPPKVIIPLFQEKIEKTTSFLVPSIPKIEPLERIETKQLKITMPSLIPSEKQLTGLEPKIKEDVFLVTTPLETPLEIPIITPITTPVTTPITTPALTPVLTPALTPVITPVITPIIEPPVPPLTPIWFPSLDFGFIGKPRKKKGKGYKRGYLYMPSFEALEFGIFGKKPPSPMTGLELRPLLPRRRRKR